MSATPAIRLVAWLDRPGNFVFVAVPNERGRYMRTDKSVVLVACPACNAAKGEPCNSRQGYSAGTHAIRRTRAKVAAQEHGLRVDDEIESVYPGHEPPPPLPLIEPGPDFNIVVRLKDGQHLALLKEPKPL